jgi:hypothetical protein
MTEFGDPITTEQAVWAILKLIESPIVGDLTKNSTAASALAYCKEEPVFSCLSTGEQRLVRLANGVFRMDADTAGSGVAALGAIDHDNRRKVWIILGYLYLGRDILNLDNEHIIDMGAYRAR